MKLFVSIYECEGKDYKPAYLEEIDAEQEEFFNEQLRTLIGNQIQSQNGLKNSLSVDKEKTEKRYYRNYQRC